MKAVDDRYPDHYFDEKGKEIWGMVVEFLEQKRAAETSITELNQRDVVSHASSAG